MKKMHALAAAAVVVASATSAQAATAFGITTQNILFSFETAAPADLTSAVSVTGLQPNENILGIDFRPSDLNGDAIDDVNRLYGIGSSSRLYSIDTNTGAATAVGGPLSTVINGTEFGFDFNPTIDRIRLVSDTDRNFVLNPDSGALQLVATPLFYAAGDPNFGTNPSVIGSAYTNSFQGATASQLYGIDSVLNTLVTQANNAGTLNTVGPLGIDTTSLVGFDIGPGNIGYAIATRGPNEVSDLYTIDLATGAATLVGRVDGGLFVRGLAVQAEIIPEPTTLTVLAAAGLLMGRRRR